MQIIVCSKAVLFPCNKTDVKHMNIAQSQRLFDESMIEVMGNDCFATVQVVIVTIM